MRQTIELPLAKGTYRAVVQFDLLGYKQKFYTSRPTGRDKLLWKRYIHRLWLGYIRDNRDTATLSEAKRDYRAYIRELGQ